MSFRVYLISLGCAKNLVDSEHMLHLIQNAKMTICEKPENVDIAIVNTCGFIESAKSEAIDVILQLASLKEQGLVRHIIVTGCLSERYRDEILKEFPEVDGVTGTGNYHTIVDIINAAAKGAFPAVFDAPAQAPLSGRRILLTPKYSAYIKIAEGCDNRCSYCVIPSFRGPFRSRPCDEIVKEAKELAKSGVKELILVAQDTSRYGKDLAGRPLLAELLEELCEIEDLVWIRLHYLYPDEVDNKLIDTISKNDKIVNYFDIPIQHVNDKLLKAMNRRGDKAYITALFNKIRSKIPDAVIRTSLIVGLPYEGEDEFCELYSFLKEMKLSRTGIFTYSPEEETSAALMPCQVDFETAQKRQNILIELQSKIMDEANEKLLGKTLDVLVEGYDSAQNLYFGRSYADSLGIDGTVYFSSDKKLSPGDFAYVKINKVIDFCPAGEFIGIKS